jgi:ectoine hydroxylase-related dioxygenase (phytanoyl-CoA dioxygenase family)
MSADDGAQFSSVRQQFETAGYCFTAPVIPQELLERANKHMDAVMAGEYETGTPPLTEDAGGDADPTKLVKIDQPHLADRTIQELVSQPDLGRWAAAATGAEMVQVWAVQLLHKPAGGTRKGNVGWHQDFHYWRTWWDGEVFTAWLPIVDVTAQMGPVRYVPGSHRWGYLADGDFFSTDLELLRASFDLPEGAEWREVEAVLPAGAAAMHHRMMLHGSGPNMSAAPRRSFAIHLRTEKSRPLDTALDVYVDHLDDPDVCPVIYQG